ncbi:MAG: hypothetical protein R3A51_16515 [Nannocystaceae bacterium]
MSLRLRAVLLSAAVGLACGCLLDNPLYDGAFTDSDASTRVTTGSTGTPTTDAPTSAGTDPTGSDSDDSVTTTDAPTTDTATTDTTLDTVDILADQAGCLGLPKGNQGLVLAVDCEIESSVGNGHGDLGEMVVDLVNGDFKDRETRSFLRFPWPAALDGAQIVAVELLLTSSDHDGQTTSDQSGEIWACEAFDLDVVVDEPALVDAAIAPDQGAVDLTQQVSWTLPVSVLVPGQPTHLAVVPVSDDGVNYWNNAAPQADWRPLLRVTIL